MSSWNNLRKCSPHSSIAWQAVALALLLLPFTASMANAQITLTVSFLFAVQSDDKPVPATGAPDASTTTTPAPVPAEPADEVSVSASASTPEASASLPANADGTAQASAAQESVSKQTSRPETSALSSSDTTPDSATPPTQEKQLSVEPGATLLPADRPSWIGSELDLKSATHRFVVSSFPTARESDVDSNLDACLVEAASNYVNQLLNDDRAGLLLAPHLNAAFVRTNLMDDRHAYLAELTTTGGAMFQKWVMVEVTKEQQEQIRTWYQEQIQRQRMIPLGIGLACLVTFVGACNLYFRRSANKSQQQSPMLKVIGNPSSSCCGKRGGWGYAFAIAVAIAVAVLARVS